MPVTDTIIEESFDGNGSTTTPYPITIPRALDEDIKLKVDNVLTTAFSIAVDGIRTDVAVLSGTTVVAYRDTPLTQSQPFPSNTTPAAEDVRAGLDKVTLITQELKNATNKSLKAGEGETAPLGTVVKAVDTTMGQDATGTMVNRSASEQTTWLNLPETVIDRSNKVWADDAARALAVPDYIGQDGHQVDTSADYYSTGVTAGDWMRKVTSSIIPVDATFVSEGDSITAGTGGQTATPWSTVVQTLSNVTDRGTFSNQAVSGSNLAAMHTRYAANVEPLKPAAGKTAVLMVMIGANDRADGSLSTGTLATWFTSWELYMSTAKADGFTVVAMTPTSISVDAPVLRQVSDLMLGSSIPDVIVDVNQILPDANDTRFYLGDALHLTALGGQIIAEAVNNAITNGTGRDRIQTTRSQAGELFHGDKCRVTLANGRMFLGDSYANGGTALIQLNGDESLMRFSRTTNEQKTSLHFGIAPAAGSIALGSLENETVLAGVSGSGIALAVGDTTALTQSIRWRLEDNGIWRASKFTSMTDYSQANSAQFGLAAGTGSHVIGSTQNDVVLVAPSGSDILFGTNTAGTQTTRMRIKDDGDIDLDTTKTLTGGTADFQSITLGTITISTGSGTPEAVVTANVGSTFHRTDGGASTCHYVKETGTGNTGWVAK